MHTIPMRRRTERGRAKVDGDEGETPRGKLDKWRSA